MGNYSLYGYLSSPLCPAYPTTNIKWFSSYMHRTAGLLKEKVLMYVILTRKRTILSISSLFHSEQVITDPAPQDRDTSKNQALKANYPSLRFWNTQVTVLPSHLPESVFSNCKYFQKNNHSIKPSELSSQFPDRRASAQEVRITCPVPRRKA